MTPQTTVAPWVRFPGVRKLPGRSLICTEWLDDLGEILAREAEPKRFSFERRADRGPSELTMLALPRSRLYGVSHGGAVSCLTRRLNCFEFLFVIRGSLLTGIPATQHRVSAGQAALHLPGGSHFVRWKPGSQAIVLRIEPSVLRPFGYDPECLAERRGRGRVRLLSVGSGLGRSLFALCGQICEDSEDPSAVVELIQQEELLLYAVELIVDRLADSEFTGQRGESIPPYLKTAVDYIHSNLDTELDARKLAAVSGKSIRTLQQAFSTHFGKGPLTFVKHARLKRIRQELRRASPWETTVTEIATRWGFTHLSNFSSNYAKMFGETPSETLRKSRRGTVVFPTQ